jgi:ribosomal protein S6--L-glutamate ligase
LVLEVNSSPGLEGIEQATGVDIAGCIIDHVAAGAPVTPKSRGRGARKSGLIKK